MDYLEFIDKDYTKIHMRMVEDKDALHYDRLFDMGLIPITIKAVWTGYWRSIMKDYLSATAHAGAYIALNAPELIVTKVDPETGTDYMTVLSNIMLHCEDLDLSIS